MTTYHATDTLLTRMVTMLCQHAMQHHEALAVLDIVMTAEGMDTMTGRWTERADSFAIALLNEVAYRTRREAVRWIDTNLPGHFARGALHMPGTDRAVVSRPEVPVVGSRVVCDLSRIMHTAPGHLLEGKVLEVASSGEVVLYKVNIQGVFQWIRPSQILVTLPEDTACDLT